MSVIFERIFAGAVSCICFYLLDIERRYKPDTAICKDRMVFYKKKPGDFSQTNMMILTKLIFEIIKKPVRKIRLFYENIHYGIIKPDI